MINDELEKSLILDLWRFWEIAERYGYTEKIADYYLKLSKEDSKNSNVYFNISESMRNCHKIFDVFTWRRLKVKAVNKVNLCHNRFCSNCAKLIQATRLKRMYEPMREAEKTKFMYHTVWTVPSCTGENLSQTLYCMNKAFSVLIRYFSERKKIKGYDFSRYGFYAAVKSIECTYKNNGTYHPHFHAIFAFDDPFPVEGDIENKFSFSKSNRYRKFSEEVVFFQKFWRLLYDFQLDLVNRIKELDSQGLLYIPCNDIFEFNVIDDITIYDKKKKKRVKLSNANIKAERVTLQKVESLSCGYSVVFDPVDPGSYFEVFKYAFKSMSETESKKKDNQRFMTYQQFKVLRKAFYNKKTIQSYGAWHNIKLDDSIDEDISDEYKRYVAELNRLETPERHVDRLIDLLRSAEEYNYKIIGGSGLNKYLPGRETVEQVRMDIHFYEKNPSKDKRRKY